MGTVYLGRLLGPAGFSKVVAIKRLHAAYGADSSFVAAAMDEARVASRVRHPNVVQLLDVVTVGPELLLVLEYIHGETLAKLLQAAIKTKTAVPPAIAVSILAGALHGLHAAHEATSEHGQPLDIVHRDVSPQNILVGVDGVARVCDFGVAKAAGRLQTTTQGEVKGKFGYMSPEQINGEEADRRSDIFSAAVVAWETLTCKRLFHADNQGAVVQAVLNRRIAPPSELVPSLPKGLDEVILRGLARERGDRYPTAHDFAVALENAVQIEPAHHVGRWVASVAANALEIRADDVAEVESLSIGGTTASGAQVPRRPPEPPKHEDRTAGSAVLQGTRPAPGGRYLLIAGVAAVMFAAGLGVQRLGSRTERATPAAPAPASSSLAATPPSSSIPPPASEAPPAPPTPPVEAIASARRPGAMPFRRTTQAPRVDAGATCTPPFTYFDPVERIEKVKPECRGLAK
jgi:serine/threonine-protein kinase